MTRAHEIEPTPGAPAQPAHPAAAAEPRRRNVLIPAGAILALAAMGIGGVAVGRMTADSRPSSADGALPSAPSAVSGTPRPSEAAGSPSTAEPSKPSSSASSSTFNDYELKAGQSTTIKGAAIVQGDVIVDGVVLYDNNPKTGLIVEIDGGTHKIDAPFGADVQAFGEKVNRVVFDSTLGLNVGLMKEKGCDPKPKPGCDSVNVVKIGEKPAK